MDSLFSVLQSSTTYLSVLFISMVQVLKILSFHLDKWYIIVYLVNSAD